MSDFHKLTISNITRETDQSVSIAFAVPSNVQEDFKYTSGQYITLKTTINGKDLRRAYSICSAPHSNELRVAIKEVEGGAFSVYANRELKEGDTLEVHTPEGKFILDDAFAIPIAIGTSTQKTYAAFAAGSGITPILSMIKTVLEQSETSRFVLVYGNKRPGEAMFRDELLRLRETYKDRFSIEWIYSQSREDGAHFGRIMKSTVNFVVKNKYQDWNIAEYYLCGPEPMIKEVTEVLKGNGAAEESILFELFTSSDEKVEVKEALDGKSTVKVIVDDEEHTITMAQDEVILDAALDNDLDPPFSCQGGICSSCIARVTEGTAVMRKNQILTDQELAEGLVLTCQAHPTSATLTVNYDEV